MRIQIARQQPDAARLTLSLLGTRLAELGLEPGAQTCRLLATQPAAGNPRPPRLDSEDQ